MSSSWDTWVSYFRDSVQNMMLNEEQIKESLLKECHTKAALFCPSSGNPLAADQGFDHFKSRDVLRLCNGVAGDQDVFSGLSWGSDPDSPSGYSIIRLVTYPLNSSVYPDLSANILYGRNKTFPEESIFVCNSLTACVVILFRLKGANKGLIHKAMNHFVEAISKAIDLGV
ncbi:uncharacterized protein LOC134817448 [Bolinopsis microptera]|uniref:uncharacterized protein LOC134817448 n=1 Tax=Bolinopsis microptera TaxID=2820187 RepID=UPI00307A3971